MSGSVNASEGISFVGWLWIIIAILIAINAIAITVLIWKTQRFRYGWKDFGVNSHFESCEYCNGGVQVLGWDNETKTTYYGKFDKKTLSMMHTQSGGYFQPNQANTRSCQECSGLGGHWIRDGDRVVGIPTTTTWRRK